MNSLQTRFIKLIIDYIGTNGVSENNGVRMEGRSEVWGYYGAIPTQYE